MEDETLKTRKRTNLARHQELQDPRGTLIQIQSPRNYERMGTEA